MVEPLQETKFGKRTRGFYHKPIDAIWEFQTQVFSVTVRCVDTGSSGLESGVL